MLSGYNWAETTNRSNNFSAILLLGASFVALSIFLEHLIGAFLFFFVKKVKVKVKLRLRRTVSVQLVLLVHVCQLFGDGEQTVRFNHRTHQS